MKLHLHVQLPSLPQRVWWVAVANAGFTLLAMFHLAYLGLMFGGQSEKESALGTQVYIKFSLNPRPPADDCCI